MTSKLIINYSASKMLLTPRKEHRLQTLVFTQETMKKLGIEASRTMSNTDKMDTMEMTRAAVVHMESTYDNKI